MTRTAIISDIHANLEALRAVLADIEKQGIETIHCLGDIVGYGPDPCDCADIVQERCSIVIRGNHDDAAIRGPIGFTQLARDAILYHQKVLRPRLLRPISRQRWSFLADLPIQAEWEGFLLVHGSPRDPTSEYIMDRDVLMGNETMFREIFDRFDKACFVGHTHMAGVFREGDEKTSWTPQRDIEGPFGRDDARIVINVGSVGQPRDGDPRACYLTVDLPDERFEFHRVEYDVEETRRKIREIGPLDDRLGDRLGSGI